MFICHFQLTLYPRYPPAQNPIDMQRARTACVVLHPTKERGPVHKRRKIGTEDYVSINEIWGAPEISRQEKNKKHEDENPRQTKILRKGKFSRKYNIYVGFVVFYMHIKTTKCQF